MSYKRTVPTVYAVVFPDLHILKVGYSGGQRWRNFVARGAEVLELIEFDDTEEAHAFEGSTHQYLRSRLGPGFRSANDAEPHLGIGGGGWGETYLVPHGINPRQVLAEMSVAK